MMRETDVGRECDPLADRAAAEMTPGWFEQAKIKALTNMKVMIASDKLLWLIREAERRTQEPANPNQGR